MATPIWNEKEKRWTLRIQREGMSRKFSSVKPGPSGKREVLRRAREWENGKNSTTIFVASIWPLFLLDIEKRTGKGEYYQQHEKYGRIYILPAVGKKKLSSMTQSAWQSIINEATPTQRYKKDGTAMRGPDQLSKKTLANLRDAIMAFCRFCFSDRLIDNIPTRLYVPKDAETKAVEVLSTKQIKAVFDLVATPGGYWYANAWKIMLLFGYRPGEVYGLQRSDVDHTVLTIRRSVSAFGSVTPGKNKNARRRTYLSPIFCRILNEQQMMLNKARVESEWLFPTREGAQPVPKTSYEEFKHFAEEIGFSGSPYSLRHTFISYMKDKLPEVMLKAAVGHSKMMNTFETYGHEIEGDLKKTADIVDGEFTRFIV